MKKLLFIILLSVALTGCAGSRAGNGADYHTEDKKTSEAAEENTEAAAIPEKKTEAEDTARTTEEAADAEDTAGTAEKAAEAEDAVKTTEPEDKASAGEAEGKGQAEAEHQKPAGSDKQPEGAKEPEAQPQSETIPQPAEDQKPQPAEEPKPEPEPQPQAAGYSPDNVVSLAVSKCQAGGMVTTEQHLRDNLDAGKITQEEFNAYYPLDGLEDSYYGVFVNADLNKAATASGRLLGSEEAIAQYIADMMLLESDSVFNIRYIGTYRTSGEEFYEFRCYR